MEQVVVPLLVTGAHDAVKVGVRLFRQRFPGGTVTVEELDKEVPINVTIEEEEREGG